jgi:hypothetical protein
MRYLEMKGVAQVVMRRSSPLARGYVICPVLLHRKNTGSQRKIAALSFRFAARER